MTDFHSGLTAIVPAAGIGSRMGADCPKQYLTLAGKTILEHTLGCLLSHPAIARVIVALAPHDEWFEQLAVAADPRVLRVEGGSERAYSVLNALHVVEGKWVLVHDAARPCLTQGDLDALIASAMACDGAILGSRVRDTMKRTDGAGNIVATVEREQLWHALTPQMFPTGTLKRALEEGLALGALITDEASAMERAGFTVKMVEGRADNIKVTRPEDLSLAELFLQQQSARQQARPD
ncbi:MULTISPECIES: 2-C-methyl-D-erythritol 4-phosphate cytidylyltransferase [Aeromonas]|jgi:2-C-methyl-D-erythritol 4-phosphate cytidylyltransferase|uniref:2-C-methyl-D-erythritol 4-phosphate cytidylyltransferase n=1 Tax=Aeromonas media TaxID=651 RepID=A0A6M4YNE2_AERME|nr:2-C-methyl-D-erythritol 4-phosphate cytidylyltransferase [Aeromonas media]MBP8080332.1 2-C-methyl-D-erythritol 4-phosphate cytidylyltransferase [Aeromonas sp.]AHX59566.1 2-C-methyl-D-erythritol 4-phosphate cytidylyltransferase [Aeromonas media WS]QHQ52563.1 2-C-methyl-D-erythritol 4-phosphate cytidylyltransferase [Aeromonas media]QJT26425.1 2-C-methyl-D-erythritol 4-phosphate cytidylyltransferase [Aeromonas media]QQQ12987.1 2-C-methyl-D-erythritol 4-phosphate cytidylyltransferase [Aeromonas